MGQIVDFQGNSFGSVFLLDSSSCFVQLIDEVLVVSHARILLQVLDNVASATVETLDIPDEGIPLPGPSRLVRVGVVVQEEIHEEARGGRLAGSAFVMLVCLTLLAVVTSEDSEGHGWGTDPVEASSARCLGVWDTLSSHPGVFGFAHGFEIILPVLHN